MAGELDAVRGYVTGFVGAIIGVTIAIYMVPTLLDAVGNVTGVPLITAGIVGTVVGAGILLFILKAFI